jgi:hypothetical protein
MIRWLWLVNWKLAGMTVIRQYPKICLEEVTKTTNSLGHDGCLPGWDSTHVPPVFEAGVFTVPRPSGFGCVVGVRQATRRDSSHVSLRNLSRRFRLFGLQYLLWSSNKYILIAAGRSFLKSIGERFLSYLFLSSFIFLSFMLFISLYHSPPIPFPTPSASSIIGLLCVAC